MGTKKMQQTIEIINLAIKNNPIILTMQGDISVLKSDVAVLKTDVEVLKTDVAVLKTDVAVLKTDVAVLKTDVAVLKADVEVLKADVEVLKADVAVLKADVAVLKADVAVLKADVAILKEEVHRIGLIQEDMQGDIKKILEVLTANIWKSKKIDAHSDVLEIHEARIGVTEDVLQAHINNAKVHEKS